jgi:hypothetical protein
MMVAELEVKVIQVVRMTVIVVVLEQAAEPEDIQVMAAPGVEEQLVAVLLVLLEPEVAGVEAEVVVVNLNVQLVAAA